MAWLVVQLVLLLALFSIIAYLKAVELVRRGIVLGSRKRSNESSMQLDQTTVPNAFPALLSPPPLEVALTQMREVAPSDPYTLPLGWYRAYDGPRVAFATLVNGVNHLAITGQSSSGKDNAALVMLLSLMAHHPPHQLQLCLIDGKGLDFAPFEHKAHVWRLALKPTEIAPTMAALTQERERRTDILRTAGVTKWDEYEGNDLPLLVCYISELTLLQDAVGAKELESWLNSELATGRAFGIRYIIATQTLSNFETRWRSQISLYLAGYQPSPSQDQPNTGQSTTELRAAGAIPPSELPPPSSAAGVFTAIEGRQAVTVRMPYLSTAVRRNWLARLPDCPSSTATEQGALPEALQVASNRATTALERPETALPDDLAGKVDSTSDEAQPAPSVSSSGSAVAVTVTPEERIAILHARDNLRAALAETGEQPSRLAICRQVFQGATGGAAYRKVQAVMDSVDGLLRR